MTTRSTILIRQRPAFGDALLLGPLIRTLKEHNPNDQLTILTDPTYLAGAMPMIFRHIPGVDRVECVLSLEWTTESNKQIEPFLRAAGAETPHSVKQADLVLDCNGAYMCFERFHEGNIPYGIQEFWLRHFNYYQEGADIRPQWIVPDKAKQAVDVWLAEVNPKNKPIVTIVLRAGEQPRNWDSDKHSTDIADWLHTKGFLPISIDPYLPLKSVYGVSCINRQLDFVAALLERSRLTLTPDTGLLHLAEAVGTPTVALWGIMRPELRVAGYDCTVVPSTSLGLCDNKECPCCTWKFQQWSCMYKITLPMILAGLRARL